MTEAARHIKGHHTANGFAAVIKRRHLCCFVAAGVVAVIGVVLASCATILMDAIIRSRLPMRDSNSLMFQVWQDSSNKDLPLLRNFYVWNLTNPHEVYNRTALPNVVKVGPYVYREHLYAPMESIEWSSDRTKIHFNYYSDFTWDAELSVDPVVGQLHPNDTFTTMNLALWSAAYRLNRYPDADAIDQDIKEGACLIMGAIHNGTIVGKNGYFIQPTVHEFLFGYEDEIWSALQNTTKWIGYHTPSIFKAVFNHSQPAPSPYTYASGLTCPLWDNESFCNSSGASRNTIYTGVDDVSRLAQYTEWAGQSSFWWWSASNAQLSGGGATTPVDETCQVVQGSNAMNYPPGLSNSDHPYVYIDSIFRSVKLQFSQHATVKRVPTLQFGISDDEKVVNGTNSACYGTRYPAVFNLSVPYFAPMLVSQPSFWGVPNPRDVLVDEPDLPHGQVSSILNFTINGTHAIDVVTTMDPSEAELILRVEPHTGTLMEAHGRIQMASWLRPVAIDDGKADGWCATMFQDLLPRNTTSRTESNATITSTAYFPYTMIPILYLDRTVVAPDGLADMVYDLVVLSVFLCRVIGGSIAGLAVAGAGVVLFRLARERHTTADFAGTKYDAPTPSNEGAQLLQ